MTTATRTDVHSPSNIDPDAYDFLEIIYDGDSLSDPGALVENAAARRRLFEFMAETGAKYSGHSHGGTCHCCGAFAQTHGYFYHRDTNKLIKVGESCTAKLWAGYGGAFTQRRREVKNARANQAGKAKAQLLLADAKLSRAWELYVAGDRSTWALDKVCDIVHTVVKYGNISEKQEAFLGKMVHEADNAAAVAAERAAEQAAEQAAAADCPTGRVVVTGTVLSVKLKESQWGDTLKMLVKDDTGFKCWCTVPSALEVREVTMSEGEDTWTEQRGPKGGRVEFTVTMEPSKDDPKFGFGKRPSKAKFLVA